VALFVSHCPSWIPVTVFTHLHIAGLHENLASRVNSDRRQKKQFPVVLLADVFFLSFFASSSIWGFNRETGRYLSLLFFFETTSCHQPFFVLFPHFAFRYEATLFDFLS